MRGFVLGRRQGQLKKTKMANSLSEDSEMSWDLKSCIASYAQIVYFEVLLEGAVGPQFVG